MVNMNIPVKCLTFPTEVLSEGVVMDEFNFFLNDEQRVNFHFAHFSVAANTSSDIDQHKVRELWYVLEGTSELTSTDSSQMMKKGDTFFIETKVPHQIHNKKLPRQK